MFRWGVCYALFTGSACRCETRAAQGSASWSNLPQNQMGSQIIFGSWGKSKGLRERVPKSTGISTGSSCYVYAWAGAGNLLLAEQKHITILGTPAPEQIPCYIPHTYSSPTSVALVVSVLRSSHRTTGGISRYCNFSGNFWLVIWQQQS